MAHHRSLYERIRRRFRFFEYEGHGFYLMCGLFFLSVLVECPSMVRHNVFESGVTVGILPLEFHPDQSIRVWRLQQERVVPS